MEASTFDEAYCYKGTEVLKNNFNERDPRVLSQLERMYTGARIIDLLKKPLDGNFDIAHLKKIHHYIFQDIYPWAGTIRTVNISKEILFCDAQYIEKELNKIFLQLKQEQYLKNCTDKDIAKRAAYYLGEINAIHPFREGNTRTCITFLWHYLNAKNVAFHVELIRNNPMYVRDSLVMANYERKDYLNKIIKDALLAPNKTTSLENLNSATQEQYQISKTDYEAFRRRYSVTKNK